MRIAFILALVTVSTAWAGFVDFSTPNMLILDSAGQPVDVPASTTLDKVVRKAQHLPDGEYTVVRPDIRLTVTTPDDPQLEPPVDPEPVEPDPEPEPEPEPEPAPDPVEPPAGPQPLPMTYKPQIKSGPYTDGHCADEADPAWPVKRMQPGQGMWGFVSDSLNGMGGKPGVVLEFPAELVSNSICPRAFVGDQRWPNTLVIRGIPDADGNLPRFYCRGDRRDGDIAQADLESFPFSFAAKQKMIVENVHVDGYKEWTPGGYDLIVRNSYFHHQLSGITFSNQSTEKRIEFCGVEISHNGQGNVRHNVYVHRSINSPAETRFVTVDSFWHSPANSENIKSTADVNIIKANRIVATSETDPSFSRMSATMNVSLPACSQNIIEDNLIHFVRPRNNVGKYNIGVRLRAHGMKGCDIPVYGSEQFMDPAYWADWQTQTPPEKFTTLIRNNTISCENQGGYNTCGYAVTSWGTWPAAVSASFQPKYWQPMPVDANGDLTWVERSRVILEGNTFEGYTDDEITFSKTDGQMPRIRPNFIPEDYYGPSDADGGLADYSFFVGSDIE